MAIRNDATARRTTTQRQARASQENNASANGTKAAKSGKTAKAAETPSWLKPLSTLRLLKDGFEASSSGVTRAPADPRTLASAPTLSKAPRRGLAAADAPEGTTTGGSSSAQAPSGEQAFLAKGAAKKTKSAERMLRAAGFSPGKVDAKLSTRSRDALRQFQEASGLPATGELDKKTFDRLKAVDRRRAKSKGKTVGVGQRSKKILEAEKRLRRLGYDTGKVDGVFDKNTASAVKELKKDQKELKGTSGLLGQKGMNVLARESRAFNHDAYRARTILDTKKEKRAHARAEARAERDVARVNDDGTRGLAEGARGASVGYIQQHLRAAGFDPKRTDGVFDERTAGAVKELQRKSGLEPTGTVDASTWRKLRHAKMEASSGTSPSQRIGERSSAVKRTEKLLKQLGYNPGSVDGTYDARTQRAVDRFRKAQGMGGRGKGVTASTLKKMRRVLENKNVDANELVRIMPGLSKARAKALVPGLNQAMREFGITTKKRQAAFLAQVGHESAGLRYFEEIASGAAYEGRRDLGNVRPGDGVRYKGRGPIQLTGRANYRAAGKALGLPLEQKPWLASRPSVGFRIAGWFWKSRGLNELADKGAFVSITERINGGHNGLSDRYAYWGRAKRVL